MVNKPFLFSYKYGNVEFGLQRVAGYFDKIFTAGTTFLLPDVFLFCGGLFQTFQSNKMKNPTCRRYAAVLLLYFTALLLQQSAQAVPLTPARPSGNAQPVLQKGVPDQQLLVNLYIIQPGNIESLADGFRIRYNYGYSASTIDDILKMNNFAENLSSYRENKDLIVERRPPILYHDSIFMRLTNTGIKNYRLKLYTINFTAGYNMAWVEDGWLKTNTIIDLKGDTTSLSFSVTADPASAAPNRFRVIFYGPAPLPVNFTGISTVCKNGQVQVNWSVSNELDITGYTVERSADGKTFQAVGRLLPAVNNGGSAVYNWQDNLPLSGTVFYRVYSTGAGGEAKYSSTVKATGDAGRPALLVYPNPVTGHNISLRLSDMAKGICQVSLISVTGQLAWHTQFTYSGGTGMQTISLANNLAPGNYQLEILDAANQRCTANLYLLR